VGRRRRTDAQIIGKGDNALECGTDKGRGRDEVEGEGRIRNVNERKEGDGGSTAVEADGGEMLGVEAQDNRGRSGYGSGKGSYARMRQIDAGHMSKTLGLAVGAEGDFGVCDNQEGSAEDRSNDCYVEAGQILPFCSCSGDEFIPLALLLVW
jgi:hypothetical protein